MQSSDYAWNTYAFKASDGIKTCNYVGNGRNSVSITKREANPWWMADLGSVHHIDMVKVFGRAKWQN